MEHTISYRLLDFGKKEENFGISENGFSLKIPNLEVKTIFEDTIKKWFEDSAKLSCIFGWNICGIWICSRVK